MLNVNEKQEVKCVGMGESQTCVVNQSLCQQGRRNVSVEKVECQ